MAADHKKDFAIDITINPYGECRKSEAPAWFTARPKLTKLVTDIKIKRTLKLDARKWRKKDLEDGVYAVAKYDLAIFSTALTKLEQEIDKVFDKNKERAKQKRDAKFYRNSKEESKEESSSLSTAEKKVAALWKKLDKSINDKISLALDDVEADKGDNKSAMAAGKKALKVFDSIDTKGMFSKPVADVVSALSSLAKDIRKDPSGAAAAFKKTSSALSKVESDYDQVAKNAGKVAKMFLTLGEKMAKDKKSDGELQAFGAKLAKGDMKSTLQKLTDDIKDMGDDLDDLVGFIAKGGHDAMAVAQRANKFKAAHEKKKNSADKATSELRKLSVDFKKIEKKLK